MSIRVLAVRFLALSTAALAGCTTGTGTLPSGNLIAAASNPQRNAVPALGLFELLDEDARIAASAAQATALAAETGGTPVNWQGGDATGTVTPGPIHSVNSRACRDLVHVAEQARERLTGRTTLCRDDEGGWRPLS